MQDIDVSWEHSAELSSMNSMRVRHRNLRWNPGVYTDPRTGEKTYCDVWTKYFLETCTPFNNFDDLFKHIRFTFEEENKK